MPPSHPAFLHCLCLCPCLCPNARKSMIRIKAVDAHRAATRSAVLGGRCALGEHGCGSPRRFNSRPPMPISANRKVSVSVQMAVAVFGTHIDTDGALDKPHWTPMPASIRNQCPYHSQYGYQYRISAVHAKCRFRFSMAISALLPISKSKPVR
jgi:hypothetical protein